MPRHHGNNRRVPARTLSYSETEEVVKFILHWAEANAILLPGRIPGYKRSDMLLLPSSSTKRSIWLQYTEASRSLPSSSSSNSSSSTFNSDSSSSASPPLRRAVVYSTFNKLWRLFLPQVIVTKPMSDLCWVCQKNSTAIMRTANQPDNVKSEVHVHINVA